ncbi:MAG: SDR family NAD(P)-dependent oxidoreductase [Bacteroidales bacterium]|nr:SDR family NAD(P)-dependent oxidoreductase [Bacteroidales bacterium]
MRRDGHTLKGKWAVVTGGSSGIGLCFSQELARRGCSVVMVSNEEKIAACAREVAENYGVRALGLLCDLTSAKAVDSVNAFLAANDVEPDFLINNAGIFSFAPVGEMTEGRINCFIDLHVRSVTLLSREFGERFCRRGSGRILNMSSMSCWMPMPGLGMYAATKAYIRVMTRSLHYELRDYGVTATVACPGGIATGLFGLPENLKQLAVKIGALQTPEKFVRKAVDKMLSGRKQYINGWLNRISIPLVGILPTWVRMQVKHRMLDKGIRR